MFFEEIAMRKEIDSLHIEDFYPLSTMPFDKTNQNILTFYNKEVSIYIGEEFNQDFVHYTILSNGDILFLYKDNITHICLPLFAKEPYGYRMKVSPTKINSINLATNLKLIGKQSWIHTIRHYPFGLQQDALLMYLNNIDTSYRQLIKQLIDGYLEILFQYPYFKINILSDSLISLIKIVYKKDVEEFIKNKDISYYLISNKKTHSFAFSEEIEAEKYVFNFYESKLKIEKVKNSQSIIAYHKTESGYVFLVK